jgi:beta-lactam-binding protein with PASTA domain
MWPGRRRPQRVLWPQVLELLAIVGFIVLSYHGLLWYWEESAPPATAVPHVVGMTELEATKMLSAAGLESEVVARKTDEEVPAGSVLSVEPPPGRQVKLGRLVRLTLSAGSRWAIVPDVREMSVERARALLRQENLSIGRETARYSDGIPVGYVVGHAPGPDQKVPRGTPVDILVSKGPTPQVEPSDVPGGPGRRRAEVDYVVPPGASLQEVRIVVDDRNGKRTVYRQMHRPGERIHQTLEGEGPGAVARVYLSGLLVEERPI